MLAWERRRIAALEAHGYAQSLSERLYFLSTTKTKPVTFRGRHFVPVLPSAPLRRKKKALTLSTGVERRGLSCRVTTVERTLVDGIRDVAMLCTLW